MAQKRSAKRGAKKAAARKVGKTAAKRPAKPAAKKAAAKRAPLVGTLGMVTLHVNDLRSTVSFYRDALGLRLMEAPIDTPAFGWAEFEVAPGLKLGVHADHGKVEEGARPPGGASGFYFAVRDVDATIGKLRAKGVKILDEPADKPYGRDAYIEDPSGNVIAVLTPS